MPKYDDCIKKKYYAREGMHMEKRIIIVVVVKVTISVLLL